MKRLLLALLLVSSACAEPVEVAEGFDASTPVDAGAGDAGTVPGNDAGTQACVAETDRAFCARIGKQCGQVTDFDNCDMSRTTNCGGCDAPLECGAGGRANQCGCPETNAEFCARVQKNCGQVSAEDACGLMRLVDCGTCNAPESCGGGGTANVCGCTKKTCAEAGAECGEIADGCGGTLACGGCATGFQCGIRTANLCGQEVPEIDVLPNPLNFGTVPVGSSVTRTVSIWNLASGVAGVKRENLKLEVKDAGGNWVDAPPEISGSGEIQLVLPVSGYTAAGIAESQKVELAVKYSPVTAGAKTARITIFSNDPDEPKVEVDVTGTGKVQPPCSYEVTPPALDFGIVEPGAPKTLNFAVRNLSQVAGEDCELTNLEFSPSTPAAYSLPNGAITVATIAAGATLQIPVRFAPTQIGNFPGSLSFKMSSAGAPTATVPLAATAGKVCLTLSPDTANLGESRVGCGSTTRSFTVTNVCTTSVSVTAIDLAQTGTEFRILARPTSLPYTLTPGGAFVVRVEHKPVDAGIDNATLKVTTSQLAVPYSATMTGSGTTQTGRTDTFGGLPAPKMDVLLVVDDSCSMSTHQAALSAAFPSFVTWADQQAIDYRIAVTTSSICANYPTCTSSESSYANGRFVPLSGGTRVITPSTPNKAAVFDANVTVGTNGHYDEKLIAPAHMALQPGLLNGHNSGFLRSDAQLSIVVVTDTDEPGSTPIASHLDYFRNLKGASGSNGFTLHGLIPTYSASPGGGCYYEQGKAFRLESAILQTGGIQEEICSSDYSAAMTRIGRAAFGPRTRYFLSGTPELTSGTITITHDGQPLSSTTSAGTKRWTYNPATNSIDFDLMEAPNQTKLLAISYDLACAP